MAKISRYAVALAVFLLGGSYVFSSSPACTPSRVDVLTNSVPKSAPTCAPSRVDILTSQVNAR
jgi:hypothetical protein